MTRALHQMQHPVTTPEHRFASALRNIVTTAPDWREAMARLSQAAEQLKCEKHAERSSEWPDWRVAMTDLADLADDLARSRQDELDDTWPKA